MPAALTAIASSLFLKNVGSSALSLVTQSGRMVFGSLHTALRVVVGALAAVLGIGAGALFGFVKTVQSATAEMQQTARKIASIRNTTGRSLGSSARGYFGLRAAGLSSEDASGFLSQAGPQGDARARAYGLPSLTDPNFAAALARKSAGMSFYQKQGMLGAIAGGEPSPALLQLANTKPASIEREQKFQSRVQGALGVSPEAIRRLSDELPLFQNRLTMFVETIKLKFISRLLPIMERGLEAVTPLLERNSGKIAAAIERGGAWLSNDLPQILANFLTGTALFVRGLAGYVKPALTFLDAILNGIASFVDALKGLMPNKKVAKVAKAAIRGVTWAAEHPVAATVGATGIMALLRGGGGLLARGVARGAAGLAGTPAGYIATAGLVIGGAGFEALRATKLGMFKNMPSTAQIAGYYMTHGAAFDAGKAVRRREKMESGANGAETGAAKPFSNLAGNSKLTGFIENMLNGTANGFDSAGGIVEQLKELNSNTKAGNKAIVEAVKKAEGVKDNGPVLDALKNYIGRDSYLAAVR